MKLIKKHKKVFLSGLVFILCMSFLMISFKTEAENKYGERGKLGAEVNNIFLAYVDSDSNGNYKPLLTKDDYISMFTYVSEDGVMTDNTFMDTVLILPTTRYSKSVINLTYSGTDSSKTTLYNSDFNDIDVGKEKWSSTYLLDEMKELATINEAITEINKEFGTNRKINVILSSFFTNDLHYEELTKFFVDEQIDEFVNRYSYAGEFENLNLTGFYYYTENGSNTAAITNFNEYVHKRSEGYKTLWIPYNGATNSSKGYDFGFDFVSIQTNYYFNGESLELSNIDNIALKNKYGVEVELDSDVFFKEQYNRYLDYLKYGVDVGWNKSINTYYAVTSLAIACKSKNIQERTIYDLTYKYANGTLSASELESVAYNDKYSGKFTNISKGKTLKTLEGMYSSSTECTSAAYCESDGTELTDGEYALNGPGAGWVAFKRTMDNSDYHNIIIDLGDVYSSVSHVDMEFGNFASWGIYTPDEVEYFYSTDGVNYNLMGTGSYIENYLYGRELSYLELLEPVSARYIKARVKKTSSFVFVSEFTVGQTASIELEKKSDTVIKGKTQTVAVTTKDDSGNLSVNSSDVNVVDCSISNNVLTVSAKSVGNASCTITEDKYGKTATYDVEVVYDEVISISILTNPTKTTYEVGEELDLTGGKILVKQLSGDTKSLLMTDAGVSVTGYNSTKEGLQTISVTYESKVATFSVKVNKAVVVQTISLDKSSLNMKVGGKICLQASVLPSDSTYSLDWTSSNNDVAVVDSNGCVSGLKAGNTTVVATISGTSVNASSQVSVEEVHASSINIAKFPDKLEYVQNEEVLNLTGGILKVDYDDNTSNTIKMTDSDVSVSGFDNTILGKKVITISYDGKETSFEIEIVKKPDAFIDVDNVKLDFSELQLKIGESKLLTAVVLPNDATNKDVVWKSSDSRVVEVDDNGSVTALKSGTAVITVSTVSGNVQANCNITVIEETDDSANNTNDDNKTSSEDKTAISNPSTGIYIPYFALVTVILLSLLYIYIVKNKKYI